MEETYSLTEGLNIMEEAIAKTKTIMIDGSQISVTLEEFLKYHGCVSTMSEQKHPGQYSMQLYDRFQSALEESITAVVLPSLEDKHDSLLLMELVRMWSNYKAMADWLVKFFEYLDRQFLPNRKLPSLNNVVFCCFRDLVCQTMFYKFRNTAISLINEERDGKQIDRDLLRKVSDFFEVIGTGGCKNFYKDFEQATVEDTSAYYNLKASEWISKDTVADYLEKAERCLNEERERGSYILSQTMQSQLVQIVKFNLLEETKTKLDEKQQAEGDMSGKYEELMNKYSS